MSRLTQNHSIDRVIDSITAITESQCSLSVQDLIVLNEALTALNVLKQKKGKTNEQLLKEVVSIVELLVKFFV